MASKTPKCMHCVHPDAEPPALVRGSHIYPHREDLRDLFFWLCGCGAYIGCKKNSDKPNGRPANAQLRDARKKTHSKFDPLWRDAHLMPCYDGSEKDAKGMAIIRRVARKRSYEYLAERMAVEYDDCHIGLFTLERCRQAWAIANRSTPELIREHAYERKAERAALVAKKDAEQ